MTDEEAEKKIRKIVRFYHHCIAKGDKCPKPQTNFEPTEDLQEVRTHTANGEQECR